MKKLSLPFIGFLQAFGLVLYCSLVAVVFWQGNNWFGKTNNLLGPAVFLLIFVTSALVCALISLGYPIFIFWDKKNTKAALTIVGYTAGWLVFFVLLFLGLFLFLRFS
ncbi:MAG: hypothetical protein M1120_02985 [Patescibacteria group bacterium]|nr:hypothetical protein [Patescibacteria group bacterium]